MLYHSLGVSDLTVSEVCLGSMTWGSQNNQQQANQQIDYALSKGVTFIDTAEMYAVPPTAETYGKTETIIGNWIADNRSRRSEFVLATKIAGNGLPWIRSGSDISAKSITQAIDDSLARLQTDYIDLYQLHWPNRTSPHFGKHWVGMVSFTQVDAQAHSAQMLEILHAINRAIQAGKIRHFGLSDDTTWGINEYIRLSEQHQLPRVASIQNEFSLLHTKDWPYLIENCIHADVAYLPWSPLGGGVLSGKYLNGIRPAGSRWSKAQRNGLFRDSEGTHRAVGHYCQIAKDSGITPSQLALAWCRQVEGVTSTIIGATTMEQLHEDIDAFNITLSDATLESIHKVIQQFPMPF